MMKKVICFALAAGLAVTMNVSAWADDSAAESAEATESTESGISDELNPSTVDYEESYVMIPSEKYEIPAIIGMPKGDVRGAVVMLHGTGSTKNEAGDGYKTAAPILAEQFGVATVRIDFPVMAIPRLTTSCMTSRLL